MKNQWAARLLFRHRGRALVAMMLLNVTNKEACRASNGLIIPILSEVLMPLL